jgi:hypothetical protein
MRLSNLNDLQLQALAESMRSIGSKLIDPVALEELIDRRAAMSPMRAAEMTFAYERATGVIESSCLTVEVPGDDYTWYDLATATDDLDDEIAYLDSRRLLIRSGSSLIAFCDEGEPLGEVA